MTSNLMDIESPAKKEELVVRVRGTFIDIRPGGVVPQKKRSGSAPPRKRSSSACSDEVPTCSDETQYISEWIGRAMSLPYRPSDKDREAFQQVAELGNNTVHAEENGQTIPPPKVTSGVTASQGVADTYYEQMHGRTEHTMEGSSSKSFNILGIGAGHCLCAEVFATGKCTCVGVKKRPFIAERSSSSFEGRGATIGESSTSKNAFRDRNLTASTAVGSVEEEYDFDNSRSLGSEDGDAAPDTRPTGDSKLRLEDQCAYKRLNLARNGPSKDSCHRWLEENILSKHPHPETPATREVTTLMICDIPCRQTIEQIIDAVNAHGFTNTFNLVYMPSKRPKYIQNMGYAFVNFKTAEYAIAFGKAFQNFRFPKSTSKKLSYSKPARHQGYTENVNRYIKQRAVGCLVTFDDAVNGGQAQKMCQP